MAASGKTTQGLGLRQRYTRNGDKVSSARVSNVEATISSLVCLVAGACLAAAAVRHAVYDMMLTEQLMRIAAGALR